MYYHVLHIIKKRPSPFETTCMEKSTFKMEISPFWMKQETLVSLFRREQNIKNKENVKWIHLHAESTFWMEISLFRMMSLFRMNKVLWRGKWKKSTETHVCLFLTEKIKSECRSLHSELRNCMKRKKMRKTNGGNTEKIWKNENVSEKMTGEISILNQENQKRDFPILNGENSLEGSFDVFLANKMVKALLKTTRWRSLHSEWKFLHYEW